MISYCSLLLFAAGALFDLRAFPISGPNAIAFPAPMDNRGCTDLVVLDGGNLTVYPDALSEGSQILRFPEGVSAFDIFDLDGDGATEVIGIVNDRVFAWSLNGESPSSDPTLLFQAPNQLARAIGPFPYVLGVESEGRALIGLPTEAAFELRDVTGKLVASTPMDVSGPHRASFGQPFAAETARASLLGMDGALELEVRRTIEIEPALPPQIAGLERGGVLRRRAALPVSDTSSTLNAAYWPWFPLTASTQAKNTDFAGWDVLYTASLEHRESFVRLRNPSPAGKGPSRVAPPRRFPGILLNSTDILPDFNGDGFVDLLLWSDPAPGLGINSLTRLLITDRRPVRFMVHLFDSKRARFARAATGSLLLENATSDGQAKFDKKTPVRLLITGDFDGDGRADLGCAVTATEFGVWRYLESGFSDEPSFLHTFQEPLQSVEFCEPLCSGEGASIALRGENTLYVLRAAATKDHR